MNKQEFLNDFKLKSYVDNFIGGLQNKFLATENAELYEQSYVEIQEDGSVREKKLVIYVRNEGTPEETATYWGNQPDKHPLVEKYQGTINSVNGKVVDEGEGFIVVSGYVEKPRVDEVGNPVLVNGEQIIDMIPKTWFAKEINGALDVKEIK